MRDYMPLIFSLFRPFRFLSFILLLLIISLLTLCKGSKVSDQEKKNEAEEGYDKDAEEVYEMPDEGGHEFTEINIPKFLFAPPKPSAQINLPRQIFANCLTLSDVNEILINALDNCGYERKSYFSYPNGFVLVTQLEQIDRDETPKSDQFRWSISNAPAFENGFSLVEYFRLLLNARAGYYRCFGFSPSRGFIKVLHFLISKFDGRY